MKKMTTTLAAALPAFFASAQTARILKGLTNGQPYWYSFVAETEMPDAPGVPRVVQTPAAEVLAAPRAVPEGTVYWTGNAGDSRWHNPLNWNTAHSGDADTPGKSRSFTRAGPPRSGAPKAPKSPA